MRRHRVPDAVHGISALMLSSPGLTGRPSIPEAHDRIDKLRRTGYPLSAGMTTFYDAKACDYFAASAVPCSTFDSASSISFSASRRGIETML
jgi:hypothetical protein